MFPAPGLYDAAMTESAIRVEVFTTPENSDIPASTFTEPAVTLIVEVATRTSAAPLISMPDEVSQMELPFSSAISTGAEGPVARTPTTYGVAISPASKPTSTSSPIWGRAPMSRSVGAQANGAPVSAGTLTFSRLLPCGSVASTTLAR